MTIKRQTTLLARTLAGSLMTALLAIVAITATSCDDKLSDTGTVTPTISVTMPDGLEKATVVSEKLQVKDVSSGRTTTYDTSKGLALAEGLYDLTYDAEISVPTDSTPATKHVKAYSPSVKLVTGNTEVKLEAYEDVENDDFIIQEIFFSGTLRPSGNQYNGDDYVMIYNNTDHVLYADGLSLVESKFTTVNKYDYTPNVMNEAMTVHAIYTIPGSGKDHPVQPGESLLLADTGIDHRVANENSFDLSGADFEWYDVSSSPSNLDIDSPTVPNLDKWYCYTKSFFILHNRGFRAYALARVPIDKDTYLKDYVYTYKYVMVLAAGTFPMEQTAYKMPNKWIVDAVNCSVEASYVWNVTAPSLDRGWTHCGTIDKDKTRYFKSVRRKMLYLKDGRAYLKDTNNSTEDFNTECVPSMIEKQGTAKDVNGTKATEQTWDGVTPKK